MVPGNIDEKHCNKYTTFNGTVYYSGTGRIVNGVSSGPVNICPNISVDGVNSHKIISTMKYWRSAYYPAFIVALSGLIETKPGGTNNTQTNLYLEIIPKDKATQDYYALLMRRGIVDRSNNFAGFDNETAVNYVGFKFSGIPNEKKMWYVRGSTTYKNAAGGHELENGNYSQAVNNHNAIVMWKNISDRDLNTIHGSQSADSYYANNTTGGCYDWSTGSFSSLQASMLDSKIDDGRPGSGKLLALKNGFAHRVGSTAEERINTCYDKESIDVDKAIYHSDKNMKFGCNLLKVMEDVK